MRRWFFVWGALMMLAPILPASSALFSSQTQVISSIVLSNNSFAGGSGAGTTVGTVTVTMSPPSPAFSGSLSLTGTTTGSGNDANSFQLVGSTLETQTCSGPVTCQPGKYNINIVATGPYANSGASQPETISASGPGGAGWQLAFSDEFSIPKGPSGAYMLNWQNQQTPVSVTWGTGAGFCSAGCGQVVLSSPSGWSPNLRAGNMVSLVGATNTGSGNINTNFAVQSVTDDEHFLIYMPGTSSVWGTIGVSGATIGTGPWVGAIVVSTSTPHTNPTMEYTNNGSEGWAPENDVVGSTGLLITTQDTAYTSADGVAHTYKSGHIETWNGNAGFAQSATTGLAFDYDGMPTTSGGANTGIWATWWSLGSDNSWPGSGSGGGEIDVAEFAAGTCNLTAYDFQGFANGGSFTGFQGSPSGTFIATLHQFTTTNIGGSLDWFLDGSSIFTIGSYPVTDAMYPIIDVEFPSTCSSPQPSALPLIARTMYARAYARVASGACYSSIPAGATTIPHTGTC